MNQNSTNQKPLYEYLLKNYMDSDHVDYETKQQREKEAKNRYGHLLDYAKPDKTLCNDLLQVEKECLRIRRQRADAYEQANIRRQERIEREKREEQERIDRNSELVESVIDRKRAQIKADADKKEKERKEAEEQQKIYDRINSLMQISPELADAYVHAIKEGNVI